MDWRQNSDSSSNNSDNSHNPLEDLIRLEQVCENAINLVRNNARHSKYFFSLLLYSVNVATKTETDR